MAPRTARAVYNRLPAWAEDHFRRQGAATAAGIVPG